MTDIANDIPGLDFRNHRNPDEHNIGDTLPSPLLVRDIDYGAADVGVSPFPAREDHVHGPGNIASAAFPTTNLYQGRRFVRTDIMREYIYDTGAWWRLRALSSAGRMRLQARRVAASAAVTTATVTDIAWDTEDTDNDNTFVVPVTSFNLPTDIKAGTTHAGSWLIGGYIIWSAAPGANSWVEMVHSGGEEMVFYKPNTAVSTYHSFVAPAYQWASGTIKFRVYQDSGANRTYTGKVWLEWCGP